MKFQLGDKVLLIHSNEEGEIVDIINNKMVSVEVEGVRFPVYIDQIDYPYFKRFTEKKTEPKKKIVSLENLRKEKATARYKVGNGVWVAFFPVFDKDFFDEDIVDYFKLYLVNQTEFHYKFLYRLKYQGNTDFELKNEIGPLQDIYLHDVPLTEMSDSPKLEFEFSLDPPEKGKAKSYEVQLKPKAKQLFEKIADLRKNLDATFSFSLFDSYPDVQGEELKLVGQLAASGFRVRSKALDKALPPPQTVVDLHIDKLTDRWKGLSNSEILEMQMKEFEKHYERSIHHLQPYLIVIHGVGKGRLREEIHEQLRFKKEVKSFVNQFHPSFGYGATEIYLEYK